MATKKTIKQKNNTEFWQPARKTLAVSEGIILVFMLSVTIATGASLSPYLVPHAFIAVAALSILFFSKSKTLVYVILPFALLGAVSAIALTIAFLPYYTSYLNHMNSIK